MRKWKMYDASQNIRSPPKYAYYTLKLCMEVSHRVTHIIALKCFFLPNVQKKHSVRLVNLRR